MIISFIQSLFLGGASLLFLLSANQNTVFENIILSLAVTYSYWISRNMHRPAYWLPLLMLAGMLASSPNVHSVLMLVISFLTVMYFLQHKFSFRSTPLLKNLTVAVCWSILVALPDTEQIFALGGGVFFTTLALSLCIDFVQRKEDLGMVQTVPHIIGSNFTLLFSVVFVLIGQVYAPSPYYTGIWALAVQAGLSYLPKEWQRETLRELPFFVYAIGIYLLYT